MERNSNPNAQREEPGSNGPMELTADILIGRIIDGEASAEDRAQFEELAAINSALWKSLAVRQQDMASLILRFDEETRGIDRIELPQPQSQGRSLRMPWLVAFTGWAAMFIVAILWGMQHASDLRERDQLVRSLPANSSSEVLTPEDHLRAYLHAPFVVGEWEPTLLRSEPASNGRTLIRMLRRIEETAYIDANQELPISTDGRLTKPPAQIRREQDSSAKTAPQASPN